LDFGLPEPNHVEPICRILPQSKIQNPKSKIERVMALTKSTLLLAAIMFSISILADRLASSAGGQGNCAECHKKQGDQVVALYLSSTHAEAGLSCSRCHGGNASATDKATAHAGRFVARPEPAGVMAICGSCHSGERDTFKSGRHFQASSNTPRMDCSQCHGAHGVGSGARSFSFVSYCAGCHGLEYLPPLPTEFQKMLASVDEQAAIFGLIRSSGHKPSDDLIRKRKELRRAIGEIVHRTDMEGGLQKIPEILKRADELKQAAGAK
jgi:Cytochrome c3